jgi:hypothetical protein
MSFSNHHEGNSCSIIVACIRSMVCLIDCRLASNFCQHRLSGPIIRLSPSEVHIQDSSFFHVLYSQTRLWDKPKHLQHRFKNDNGVFTTPSHEVHRHRRAAVSPFFSKRKISQNGPSLQLRADQLCDIIEREYKNSKKILQLDAMFACFVADTIVSFCFDKNYKWLESPDFHCDFAEAMDGIVENVHLVTQFSTLAKAMNMLSDRVLAVLNPSMKVINDFQSVSEVEGSIRLLISIGNAPANL